MAARTFTSHLHFVGFYKTRDSCHVMFLLTLLLWWTRLSPTAVKTTDTPTTDTTDTTRTLDVLLTFRHSLTSTRRQCPDIQTLTDIYKMT